jgi:hypothetical protein
MDLSRRAVKEIFFEKDIGKLYHANSVLTSCNFLREGFLFSRGSVERQGFPQTEQYSDTLDKQMGLWYDVFVDTVDIHERAKRINSYGPVLFELDVDSLLSESLGKIWISKLNPTAWDGKTRQARWFQSLDEVRANFTKGTFNHMVVFRHSGGQIPLSKHLKRIILDDPNVHYIEGGIDFYSIAYGALKASMTLGKINVPIVKRKCTAECKCSYRHEDPKVDKMFIPAL